MQKFKPLRAISPEHSMGVGDIITKWSYLESVLRDTAYTLLRVNPKEGRVAVREPRAKDYVLMLGELAELNNVKLTGDIKKLSESIEDFNRYRDWLAHSVWVTHEGRIYLQVISGTWRPPKSNKKISRKIKPQGFPVTMDDLLGISDSITNLTDAVEALRDQVRAALKSSR